MPTEKKPLPDDGQVESGVPKEGNIDVSKNDSLEELSDNHELHQQIGETAVNEVLEQEETTEQTEELAESTEETTEQTEELAESTEETTEQTEELAESDEETTEQTEESVESDKETSEQVEQPEESEEEQLEESEEEQSREKPQINYVNHPVMQSSELEPYHTEANTRPNEQANAVMFHNGNDSDDEQLVVVDIDRQVSIEEAAYSEARRKLSEELAKSSKSAKGFFGKVKSGVTNLWKGNVFRGYYERKYQSNIEKEINTQNNILQAKLDSGEISQADIPRLAKQNASLALMYRMSQDNEAYISHAAGESREALDQNSKQYKQTVELMRQFAYDEIDSDEFSVEMGRLRGGDNAGHIDNYASVALYIKGQLEHIEGSKNVEDRFNELTDNMVIYNAESREGVRTAEHRTKVDSVVEKLSHSKIGSVLSPEAIAGAASVAVWMTTAAARNKALAYGSMGGSLLLTGAVAAAQEGNKISTDRMTMARRAAEGDRKLDSSKFGDKMKDTMLNMVPASSHIKSMKAALEVSDSKERMDSIKAALAESIINRQISDIEGIDLIRYSSANAVESERLDMITTELKLKAELIRLSKEKDPNFDFQLDFMKPINDVIEYQMSGNGDDIDSLIDNDVSSLAAAQIADIYRDKQAKDKTFRKLRHKSQRKAATRAMATALVAGTVMQEAVALANDNVRGVIEGVMNTNQHAKGTTMLEAVRGTAAEHFGWLPTGKAAEQFATGNYSADKLSPAQAEALRHQGYNITEQRGLVDHYTNTNVSAAELAQQNNPHFGRNGWYDISQAHGNLNFGDGQYSYTPGGTLISSHGTVSADQLLGKASQGGIKLMVSPTKGTQWNPFEVSGHVDNGHIIFDVQPGSPAEQMLANRSYAFAEVVDTSNNLVMSTAVGSGNGGIVNQLVNNPIVQTTGWHIEAPAPVKTGLLESISNNFANSQAPLVPPLFGLLYRRNLDLANKQNSMRHRFGAVAMPTNETEPNEREAMVNRAEASGAEPNEVKVEVNEAKSGEVELNETEPNEREAMVNRAEASGAEPNETETNEVETNETEGSNDNEAETSSPEDVELVTELGPEYDTKLESMESVYSQVISSLERVRRAFGSDEAGFFNYLEKAGLSDCVSMDNGNLTITDNGLARLGDNLPKIRNKLYSGLNKHANLPDISYLSLFYES